MTTALVLTVCCLPALWLAVALFRSHRRRVLRDRAELAAYRPLPSGTWSSKLDRPGTATPNPHPEGSRRAEPGHGGRP